MSSTTPAGWYPDPEREGATRWWDGAQWAPSQEPAAADDRFKPKDESDASAGAAPAEQSWSPEPYSGPGTAWDGQDAAATSSSTASWSPTPASTPDPSAAEPAWQQQETPSWQPSQSSPAWGQQAAQPSYGAPQDYGQTGAQQWNSYGAAPKKRRTGLFIGIGAGVLVLLLVLVGGGIILVSNLIGAGQQQVAQGGGVQGPGSFSVTVDPDGQSFTDIEITTAGEYQIDVISTNDEDPRIELSGNGQSWSDDDGGDETYASRLIEYLDVGTYTLMVEEYSGDPLQATVTVQQR